MSIPDDPKLYEQVKNEIYKKYPKHSAYRSGLLVKEYKARGGTYSGDKNKKEGLTAWFAQNWKNQRGETVYEYKSDIYRPTVKVGDTPKTFAELSKKEIEKARREKARKGRVKRF